MSQTVAAAKAKCDLFLQTAHQTTSRKPANRAAESSWQRRSAVLGERNSRLPIATPLNFLLSTRRQKQHLQQVWPRGDGSSKCHRWRRLQPPPNGFKARGDTWWEPPPPLPHPRQVPEDAMTLASLWGSGGRLTAGSSGISTAIPRVAASRWV